MAETKILTPRIEIRGIKKTFNNMPVLKGVSLKVYPGKTLAIIGRSGSGKSTLLRCISCLDKADDGEAFLSNQQYLSSGNVLEEPWKIRSRIIMVFQEFSLFPNMTGFTNITLALEKTKKTPAKEAKDIAMRVAATLGIDHVLQRFPNELSHGQAQRLALARAMVLQPELLLLDEITSALDPETILNVVEAIRDLRAADLKGDMSIILVTHLMRFAEGFADSTAFLHDGHILEEHPSKKFINMCEHPETRKFVSTFKAPY